MKTYRTLAIAAVAATLALSGSALAQRGPGGGSGTGSGMGSGMGSGTGQGMGPGGGSGEMGRGPGGEGRIQVAPDGTSVYVKRTATTSGSTTTVTEQLVAVSAAGKAIWNWTPPEQIHEIAFPTGLVALTVGTPPATTATATSPTSRVVGLNVATGAQMWSTAIDGLVHDLQVSPTGLLAVVTKVTVAGTSTTPPTVAHSLVSINLSGTIAWTYSLD